MSVGHKILVTGAGGQIGTELVAALREQHGWKNVIASDIYPATDAMQQKGIYIKLDVLNKKRLSYTVRHLAIQEIYHLAAVLSAKGEQNPVAAWDLNMAGLLNVLEVAREQDLKKIFWPSSIAVFGPGSMPSVCFQNSKCDPETAYGIAKVAGEYWCRYYREKYGLDIRSVRYPGLIGHTAAPGGGTTDYAVEIFHSALAAGSYTCFLEANTCLPMMYMPDAVRAALELMETPKEKLTVQTSYNLSAMQFTPAQLAAGIRQHLPGFQISYAPDSRQRIAAGWPQSIDDSRARLDWGWRAHVELPAMVENMLAHLQTDKTTAAYA